MRDQFQQDAGSIADIEASLIQDLERQNRDEIRKLRAHDRIEAEFELVLRPANASDTTTPAITGTSSDISRGGCGAVFPAPIGVGDVFRLDFDPAAELPTIFARCLRCRIVREGAFEAGFQFFTEVTLPGAVDSDDGNLLT